MQAIQSSAAFNLTCDEFPRLIILRLRGDVGAADVAKLRLRLQGVLRRQPSHVILDLSDLGYLGSMAIGALLEFRQELRRLEGALVLVAVPEAVGSLLHVSRVDELFAIADSMEDALQRVSFGPGVSVSLMGD